MTGQKYSSISEINKDLESINIEQKVVNDNLENQDYTDFAVEVSSSILGSVQDFIEKAVQKSGGNKVSQHLLGKPIFLVSLTLESLNELKNDREQNGEQSYQDKIATISEAVSDSLIALALGAVIIPASAGFVTTIASGIVIGAITEQMFEANFFDDGTSLVIDAAKRCTLSIIPLF